MAGLVVKKGNPYDKGTRIPLKEELVIGRSTSTFLPDVCFESSLISRKHCCITSHSGDWFLQDIGSKHGTTVNGEFLPPFMMKVLHDGDIIGLASNVVVIRFTYAGKYETTLEFDTQPLSGERANQSLVLDTDRMRLAVDGRQVLLSTKEWLLLCLLNKHANKLVSYEDIRLAVWAERPLSNDGFPDVGLEEISILVYRLRRKLGLYSGKLRTVRGRGCIFEPW